MNGTFTGKATLNKMDSKFPYYSSGKTKNGDKYHRFNLAVTDDKNNRAMLELFGMVQDEIKTMNTDNEKISIKWDDRDDQAIVNTVASYKKNVFSFVDDERKEFISTYDAVKYLNDHADDLKDKKIGVTCQVEKNIYNGKVSNRYVIRNIYSIDEDKKGNKLKITGDFFFNKDSIDISEWKKSQKLILNGYTQAYVSDKKKMMYFPETIVFDCGKADLDNEDHVKQVRFKLSCINCDLKDGKISTKLKSSTMYKIGVELRYINSAQEVEFDESMLTDRQKMAIDLGLKTIEDFTKGNRVFGERVTEFKLIDFQIEKDAYSEGCVDLEIKPSEFEEDVYTPAEEESEDILDGVMNAPEDEDDDDDGDSLFDD